MTEAHAGRDVPALAGEDRHATGVEPVRSPLSGSGGLVRERKQPAEASTPSRRYRAVNLILTVA
jgi:hypothetical protein